MNDEIESLIEQWFDGELDAARQDELVTWLKTNPGDMQRFVEANVRDQMLRDAALGEFFADEVQQNTPVQRTPARSDTLRTADERWSAKRIMATVAALAACLMIAVICYQRIEPEIEKTEPFSSIAMLQDFAGNLKVGDRLGAETIEINRGIVCLLFDDGVEVTLQGPAQYKLIAPGRTQLLSGLLTATVPPGAEGFRVDTPTAQVIDLGTAFGIEQREDGTSKVSVFDGEIEVIGQKDSGEKRLLTEGQAIQLAADGSVIETEFASKQFEKLWPTASGIAGSTGAFKFAPQWPRMLKQIESDEDIFILPEGYAMELEQSCEVDMTGNAMSQSVIPSGQRVRSFLLQFNPVDSGSSQRGPANRGFKQRGSKQRKRIKGNITFQRPILGLIVTTETLKKTDDLFSLRRAGGLMGRGLEFKPPRMADEISLSEDRMTLTLDLAVINRLSDHVRVIVDAELAKPNN